MRYILKTAQMQQCDANTIEHFGIPSAVLMERAAMAVVGEIAAAFPDRRTRILVACGVGNNGGDGLSAARLLSRMGYEVMVLFPGDEEKCSVEAARQLGIVKKYGIKISDQVPERPFDVIVDALFGIGLTRDLKGIWREVVERLNRMEAWKVAVDIPSGISADTGQVMGAAFAADLTATFGFAKPGLLLYPGAGFVGKLVVEEIGIDEMSLLGEKPDLSMAEPADINLLPVRPDDSNKGTFGKLLIFAGSYNMAGAAAFSAMAAYQTGAGLVRVVTDDENRGILQTLVPEAVLSTYDAKTDMEALVREQAGWADAVVLGPGIGQSRQAEELVHSVLRSVRVPCVVDADGLNLLAAHLEWIKEPHAQLIVTPHPGEMSRLLHAASAEEVKRDLLSTAAEFSERFGVITVLKDARTVICAPDGGTWINTTGNNGMATAGSGDVLSGILGALLGQGMSADKAAVLGVLLHGLAGDASAAQKGCASLVATDIILGIAEVLRKRDIGK